MDPAERKEQAGSFKFKMVAVPVGGPILETRLAVPCCERDADEAGKCDRHPTGLYEVIL